MSKKGSKKKTDQNADQNKEMPLKSNDMDENISGMFLYMIICIMLLVSRNRNKNMFNVLFAK